MMGVACNQLNFKHAPKRVICLGNVGNVHLFFSDTHYFSKRIVSLFGQFRMYCRVALTGLYLKMKKNNEIFKFNVKITTW